MTDTLAANGMELNGERYSLVVKSIEYRLSPREFQLLHYLMLNKNRVLTREQIVINAFGAYYSADTHIVDVLLQSIRRKTGQKIVETLRGFRYWIRDDQEQEASS